MWPLASFGHHDPHVVGELVLECIGKRGLGDRLAGVSIQGGLGVEALEVAGAADHEQPDHVLGLGREMRPSVRRAPAGRGRLIGPRDPVAMEHRAQRQAGETHSHIRQERSSVLLMVLDSADRHKVVMVQKHVNQVLAARCAGSAAGGTVDAGPAENGVRLDRSASRSACVVR